MSIFLAGIFMIIMALFFMYALHRQRHFFRKRWYWHYGEEYNGDISARIMAQRADNLKEEDVYISLLCKRIAYLQMIMVAFGIVLAVALLYGILSY